MRRDELLSLKPGDIITSNSGESVKVLSTHGDHLLVLTLKGKQDKDYVYDVSAELWHMEDSMRIDAITDLRLVDGLRGEVTRRVEEGSEDFGLMVRTVSAAISECFKIRSPEKIAAVLGISPEVFEALISGAELEGITSWTIKSLSQFAVRCNIAFKTINSLETIQQSDKITILSLFSAAGRTYITSIVEGVDRTGEIVDLFVHGATPGVVKLMMENYPVLWEVAAALIEGVDIPIILRQMLGVREKSNAETATV